MIIAPAAPRSEHPAAAGSRGGRSAFGALARTVADDANSVAERQFWIAGVYFASLLLLFIPGVTVEYRWPVVIGSVVIAAATVGAFALRGIQTPPPVAMLIPLVDILAIGFLRAGTGGYSSIFTIMMVLPVLSLGIERGRWPVLIGGPVTVFALSLPVFNDPQAFGGGQWIRLLYTPFMLGLLCLSVNELTRRLRLRIQAVRALQQEQESLLSAVEDQVEITAAASNLLRESSDQLSSTINAVTEQSIIATDRSGRIEIFNSGAQKMLGIAAHDVIGRPITQFHRSDELVLRDDDIPTDPRGGEPDRATNPFVALIGGVSSGAPRRGDWTYVTRTGDELRVHLAITQRYDAAHEVDGYLFVATDVTQDRAQAKVREEFVTQLSNELSSPLAALLAQLQRVNDDPQHRLSAEQLENLDAIERNANRLARVVSDLTFTADVEAGRFPLTEREVDLRETLAVAVRAAGEQADAKGVRLELVHGTEPVAVLGDPCRLGQAVDNLIGNAVKFTPAGGRVAVTLNAEVDEEHPKAFICVSDTGVGIPADELDRLFGRFFRASTATKFAVPGVGLGLSITQAIAHAHRGVVRVASTVGEGTCCTLELPLLVPTGSVRR
jgi:signal transduction histidine kinase